MPYCRAISFPCFFRGPISVFIISQFGRSRNGKPVPILGGCLADVIPISSCLLGEIDNCIIIHFPIDVKYINTYMFEYACVRERDPLMFNAFSGLAYCTVDFLSSEFIIIGQWQVYWHQPKPTRHSTAVEDTSYHVVRVLKIKYYLRKYQREDTRRQIVFFFFFSTAVGFIETSQSFS